jgi:peptidoglycan/LPS O-acetylase OafA/YrhL
LLYPGLIFVVSFVLIVFGVGDDSDILSALIFVVPIALIPISMTVAITRYRLFEIDRIISRTLAYLLVVGLLAATYFGAVTFITTRLPAPNGVAVAGSTLLVAALFNPLRKRIQNTVDRRFNRSSYRAQQVAEEFEAQLQGSLTIGEITDAWIETVDQAFQPKVTAVWLQTEDTPGAGS